MSFSRYIAAVNLALHELVLPEIHSSRARVALLTSTRVLAGIAAAFESALDEGLPSLSDDQLPPSLRGLKTAALRAGAGPCLPDVDPVPDLAIGPGNLPFAIEAAKWLMRSIRSRAACRGT